MIPSSSFDRVREFCNRYGGERIRPLPASIPLKPGYFDKIRVSAELLLKAQRDILVSLLKEMGKKEVLRRFSVPAELAPWMAVLDHPEAEIPILRLDVLPDRLGSQWICEINVDSSVGGAEAAQFRRIEETNLGLLPSLTPYDHLAALIGKLISEHRCRKVCLMDWSTWEGYGAFSLEWLKLNLSTSLPGVDVFCATEKTGMERINKETLVYRVFLAQDALADIPALGRIFSRAGFVLSDFSGELLGNKLWLALFHEPKYRALLSQETLSAIDGSIPLTIEVTAANAAALIRERDRYYFKSVSDFGGRGVLCGKTTPATDLCRQLSDQPEKSWIAQKACELSPDFNAVLGLYRIGGHWSGALVRSMAHANVINVANGSSIGWGFESEDA